MWNKKAGMQRRLIAHSQLEGSVEKQVQVKYGLSLFWIKFWQFPISCRYESDAGKEGIKIVNT